MNNVNLKSQKKIDKKKKNMKMKREQVRESDKPADPKWRI